MTVFSYAQLTDRGAVSVTGSDAHKLLQGLVTNDLPVDLGSATFAGLLSPQGKILFDFFIVRVAEGFLLDVARDKAADLVKRLTLYRLRSMADIADRSGDYAIAGDWNENAIAGDPLPPHAVVSYADPRLAAMGRRVVTRAEETPVHSGQSASEIAYHAHRIALGVPEGGRDYAFADAFPHEALFDQLHGVSFTKGCYVGQEIVSRMEHRGTARKRIVQVQGEHDLPADHPEVMAGDVAIGTLGSVSGDRGLALVRLDRAAEFKAKGVTLTAAGTPVALHKPAFATFAIDIASGSPAPA